MTAIWLIAAAGLVFALADTGRLAAAEQLARAGAEIVASNRVPIAQIFFAANLGRVATLQGRLASARRYYAEAAGLAEASHFAGPRRLALSGLALACAMLGDADTAAAALAERATGPAFGFRQPEQQLADAWTAFATQRPVKAAERLSEVARRAASTGHLTTESWLLHVLVRTSRQDTSTRLQELATICDSPLICARARHPLPSGHATLKGWPARPATSRPSARCCSRPRPRPEQLRRSAGLVTGGRRRPRRRARRRMRRRRDACALGPAHGRPALRTRTPDRYARRRGHGQQGHR